MALAVLVEPHLGRAAAFDHIIDLFVQMLFGIERAGTRHFDHVAAPFSFGAVQLDVAAASAHAFPWGQRKILNLAHPDVAKDGNALGFHEQIVGRFGASKFSEAGPAAAGGFMPVYLACDLVHDAPFPLSCIPLIQRCLVPDRSALLWSARHGDLFVISRQGLRLYCIDRWTRDTKSAARPRARSRNACPRWQQRSSCLRPSPKTRPNSGSAALPSVLVSPRAPSIGWRRPSSATGCSSRIPRADNIGSGSRCSASARWCAGAWTSRTKRDPSCSTCEKRRMKRFTSRSSTAPRSCTSIISKAPRRSGCARILAAANRPIARRQDRRFWRLAPPTSSTASPKAACGRARRKPSPIRTSCSRR